MKKWIEKDRKHVLVVDFYGNEMEILELKEDEDKEGYQEPYFLHKSLTDYSNLKDTDFFDNLEDTKKSVEEILIENFKDLIAEHQKIIEELEA